MHRKSLVPALLLTAALSSACGGGEAGEDTVPPMVVDSGPIMGPTGSTGAPGLGTAGTPGTPGGTDPDTLGQGRDTTQPR